MSPNVHTHAHMHTHTLTHTHTHTHTHTLTHTHTPAQGVTEVLPHVEQGNRMGAPDSCTDGIYQIMKECWDKEASQRPNFVRIEKMLQFESICMA